MLTPDQKQRVIDGWQEQLEHGSMLDYFRMCGHDGESVELSKQRVIQGCREMFGSSPEFYENNGVTARQLIEALEAGEFDQEIACYMGYS